jgi:hypothetical protein
MRRQETACPKSLNPKVQGSTPCASTIMLCATVSGRASDVPDVTAVGGKLAANPPLTAFFDSLRFEKQTPDPRGSGNG